MDPTSVLTLAQRAFFEERGYLALEAITTADEVAHLQKIFADLFERRAGWERGRLFDLAGRDEEDQPAKLPQLLNPAEFAPELGRTLYRRNALAIARQLLGPEAEPWFEHAILKPAHYGAATPWHQDEAHRDDVGEDYSQISIWMPLLEARPENGCMRYVPGTHRGPVLPHRSLENDPRVTALECCAPVDWTQVEDCPLPPGGAAIHHCRTLHSAGPNQTAVPRPAYILAFRGPRASQSGRHSYDWNANKCTAAQARADAWEHRWNVRLTKVSAAWIARARAKLRALFRAGGPSD